MGQNTFELKYKYLSVSLGQNTFKLKYKIQIVNFQKTNTDTTKYVKR